MQTVNISLPDPMKQYVEEQVSTGGYSSASEYIRELVSIDQKRKAMEITPGMWEELRQKIRARAEARKR